MSELIEKIKMKIDDAKQKMQENRDQKYDEKQKREIESHIAEMDRLIMKAESEGDKASAAMERSINDSMDKLDRMLNQ